MCIWEKGARLLFVGKHYNQRTTPSSLERLAPRSERKLLDESFSPPFLLLSWNPRSSPPATHALTHSTDGGRVRDVCS